MNDNYCNICRVSFKNARGLHCHNIRNIGHPQDELSSKSSSSTDKEQMNRKQKQSLVIIEQQLSKKTRYVPPWDKNGQQGKTTQLNEWSAR